MRYMFRLFALAILALAMFACSDFQEVEEAVELKVEPSAVALEADEGQFSINVSCSNVWNVSDLPDWIALDKVSALKDWAYTWELVFKCDESEFDRTGSFTIVDSGNNEITVTVEQKGLRGQEIHVESISINPETLVLQKGEEAVITASVIPENASNTALNWEVSDEQIVSFSPDNCRVVALAPGSASIIATSLDGGFTAECKITVEQHASSVALFFADSDSKAEAFEMELNDFKPVQLIAKVFPEDAEDKTVEWHSTDESVAKISGGLVTAIGIGEADVYATTVDGGHSSEKCHVSVKCSVTGVKLNTQSISLKIGETQQLTAEVIPSNAGNKKVSWRSFNKQIATVSENGLVTAVAIGSAKISVTTDDGGHSDICNVSVKDNVIHVNSVSLSPSSLELAPGQTANLAVNVLPNNSDNLSVVWSSSNSYVATVSNIGTVTAKAVGNAVIKATSEDNPNASGSCSVTVKAIQPEAIDLGLSVKWASWNVGATKPEEYGDYFAWGETQPNYNYDWGLYKWCNRYYNKLTKYCTQSSYWGSSDPKDNKTVLDQEDDAASANWGGSWRMPTDAEWTELREKCTWTWTTQNGIKGYRVTRKTKSNSIFLPAAGYRNDTDLRSVGRGSYWSSSLYTGRPYYAYYVTFGSGNVHRSYSSRFLGFSVRPVTE